jgi:WD40 repeat protein
MGAIRGLAVAPDQASLFVTGGADRKLCWWDTRQVTGPLHVVQGAHCGEVACVAFSSSGTLLASGGADKVGTDSSKSACPSACCHDYISRALLHCVFMCKPCNDGQVKQ